MAFANAIHQHSTHRSTARNKKGTNDGRKWRQGRDRVVAHRDPTQIKSGTGANPFMEWRQIRSSPVNVFSPQRPPIRPPPSSCSLPSTNLDFRVELVYHGAKRRRTSIPLNSHHLFYFMYDVSQSRSMVGKAVRSSNSPAPQAVQRTMKKGPSHLISQLK